MNSTSSKQNFLTERTVFLFDGLGASLSLLFTGVLLPLFSDELGISNSLLHCLALYALVCAAYSFTCYKLIKTITPGKVLAIIIANTLYAIISLAVIVGLKSITFLGSALLATEIVVLFVVVVIEVTVFRRIMDSQLT